MERIETINTRLKENYGVEWNGLSIYRVVWSDDQFEKRLMSVTDTGIHLLNPEVRLVPKYIHYIQHKFILEQLVIVPDFQRRELADNAISYEPLWTFEDKHGNPLPPAWEAIQLIIKTVQEHKHGKSPVYSEPTNKEQLAKKEERIKKLEEDLFGNETNTGDALAHKQAIVVPNNYEKSN